MKIDNIIDFLQGDFLSIWKVLITCIWWSFDENCIWNKVYEMEMIFYAVKKFGRQLDSCESVVRQVAVGRHH